MKIIQVYNWLKEAQGVLNHIIGDNRRTINTAPEPFTVEVSSDDLKALFAALSIAVGELEGDSDG
jgi:hypothetical protein